MRAHVCSLSHNIRRAEHVDPLYLLAELREGNQTLAARRREVYDAVDARRQVTAQVRSAQPA